MNIKDVENLAELARLELTTPEKEQILKDMEGILAYVKVIEKVKVSDTKSEYDVYNVWREDLSPQDTTAERSRELIVEQFPDAQDNFLKVKKIL